MAKAIQIEFAMPLGQDPSVTFPAGSVALGKPFRQPFNFDGGAAAHVNGLQFVINAQPPSLSTLFAFLDGEIEFFPADSDGGDRLVLSPDLKNVKKALIGLFRRFTVEAPPSRVIYDGIDVAATRVALSTLLTQSGHPSRTGQVLLPGQEKPKGIASALGTPPSSSVLAQILDLVFKVGGSPPNPVKLRIKVGDAIAVAAPGASGKRQFVWSIRDLGGQFINPFFVLKQFVAGQTASSNSRDTTTQSLTALTSTQPVFALLTAAGTVSPRETISVGAGSNSFPQQPFSLGPLAPFHGYPFLAVPSMASLERRLISSAPSAGKVVGQTEVRNAKDHSDVPFAPTAAADTVVRAIWGRNGALINAVCAAVGLPCEILVAIVAKESKGGGNAYRLEPLKESERELMRASPSPQLEKSYDKTIGAPGTAGSVQLLPPPATLANVLNESDGRPKANLRVTLRNGLTRTMGKFKWATSGSLGKDGRRHFLIDDQGVGFRPLARKVTPVPLVPPKNNQTVSNTECDFTIDDQQLDLSRAAFKPATDSDGNVVPLQKCHATHSADTQAANQIRFYHPNDSCAAIAQAPALSDAVRFTVQRSATLRALYVNVPKALSDDLIVTIVDGSSGAALIQVTLASGNKTASEIATQVPVSAGRLLSVKVQTKSAAVTGLRVRCHLAPVDNSRVWLLDGVGHDGTKGQSNKYPTTGVNPTDNVRGANGDPDHPMTWDELGQAIEVTLGNIISPGPAQTLISAASNSMSAAAKALPQLIPSLATFGVTALPTGADHLKHYFIDDTRPNSLGWLMLEPNALLAGACHIRLSYAPAAGGATAFDFPAVCAAYNSGSVKATVSNWGFKVEEDYVRPALVFYNAVVAFFESATPPAPAPAVRFRP